MFLAIFVILIGCNDQDNQKENNETQTNQENQGSDSDSKTTNKNQENEPVTEEEDVDDANEENDESDKTENNSEQEEITEPQYELTDSWSFQPLNEDINDKVALLTIDDAPDQHAVEMAETLKELDAPAIFFVNGHFLDTEAEQEKLKQIYEMGFAIGNHTYNHQRLSEVSEEQQREEIVSLNDLIEEIIGEKPKFFRAPNGVNTDYVKQVVADEGMLLMNWTYGYDYFSPYMDAEKLATAMVTGEAPEVDVSYSLLDPGANLLMHDREWTYQALPDIVNGLRDKGYEMLDPALIKVPE